VQHELTTFPITSKVPTRGVIKVISSTTESDVNTNFAANTPAPGLREWGTHTQRAQIGSGAYYVTETLAADSNLTAGEQSMLEALCLFDNLLSGSPCVCTPEDHDF
jgi:outer membrane receptor for monomeric catechols